MKKLFTALLVTVFATGAFAKSIDITPVIARADGNFAGLTTVALLADGRLQIVGEDGLIKQVQLGERALAKITHDIHRVTNVEVKTVRNQFICMTLVAVIPETLDTLSVAAFDYQTGAFTGKPRVVLTDRGCHMRSMTYPKLAHSQIDAAAVREQLVVLALANLD